MSYGISRCRLRNACFGGASDVLTCVTRAMLEIAASLAPSGEDDTNMHNENDRKRFFRFRRSNLQHIPPDRGLNVFSRKLELAHREAGWKAANIPEVPEGKVPSFKRSVVFLDEP
jgi:hypothetical protein